MNIEVLNQINIFCNNSDINATPKDTLKLYELLNDYEMLLGTVNELNPTNPSPLLRPRLASPDNEWAVTILSNQITIERNMTVENISIDAFLKKSSEIASIILRSYRKRAKRISFSTKTLLSDMSPETLDSVYDIFAKQIGTHKEISPFEWTLRSVRRSECEISHTSESLNFITNIGRGAGTINQNGTLINFDRIYIDFDINTIAENEDIRFTHEDINEFIIKAAQMRQEEMNELEMVIYGNKYREK